MKKIYSIISLIALSLLSACDAGFDELNTNKVAALGIDPVFVLNTAVINGSYPNGTLTYDMGIVQQIVTPNSGVLTGANYNQDNRNVTQQLWQRFFRSVIRHSADAIEATKDNPERANLYNMARLWQSYAFMILTDSYGDVPYTEGAKGISEQIFFPKYDNQQQIYDGIIQTITEATAALNTSGRRETADILYGGDIDKWKKFGNSLLLRAGMRLVKADAAKAQQAVQRAIQGGLMASNADNAVIRHDPNYGNSIGQILNSTEANNFYLAKPFVDHLKNKNDPRLGAIAVRYVGAASGPEQNASKANRSSDVQIGMPMGHDNNSVRAAATADGLRSFYDYSQVDRTRMVKVNSPAFIVTYAQTQLLLAEAITRGWATGSAATAYSNAIRAHMQQCGEYDPASAIASSEIDAFVAANPLNTSNALNAINTEYWVVSFLNGPEAFANFRRSGFPALSRNPFPGQDISGDFIRRLTYPNSEISVNSANVQAAIARQGQDNLDTRVWWDK